MELTGSVESIIYRNAENGYTVLEFLSDDMERFTAVGPLALCNKGERVILNGSFVSHPRYGKQFKADSCEVLAPATLSGIEAYLGSGMIRGIGEVTARAIVQRFGMDTLEIMDNEPDRLLEVSGIGPKRLGMILPSYRENRELRQILLALEPFGVTIGQALKLYRIYGSLCLAKVEENPYQMIEDVDGIGFVTADRIAQNVPGFSADSRARICAGIYYALNEARNEYGHTCLPRDILLETAQSMLGVDEVPVSDALDSMISRGELVSCQVEDAETVFLPWLFRAETGIAERLSDLMEKPVHNPFLEMAAEQARMPFELAPQQKEAVQAAMEEGLLIITGGPGTGKTTIIRCITAALYEMQMDFVLCAPTGRAAKRMSEATGFEAKTIHRLLEYIPGEGFSRNEENPILTDMIIVDEVSMVDVPLMHALLKATAPGTRMLLVGDADQLPPVGCGDVLRNVIDSGTVRTVRLTEIFRQKQESYIITNAYRINRGEMPFLDHPESDFRFEPVESPDTVLERVVSMCSCARKDLDDTASLLELQVLVPMKKGTLGVRNMNKVLQDALNPKSIGKREQVFGETVFREGDKVMQMKNDYKVPWTRQEPDGRMTEGTGAFNGDLGTIHAVESNARRITVLFDDGRVAEYDYDMADSLDLAYCISIHKSQGSEFNNVILPLCGGTPLLLTRNLLYTAVTRAKKQVWCIGRAETIRQMVQNNRSTRRYTSLKQCLLEADYIRRGN